MCAVLLESDLLKYYACLLAIRYAGACLKVPLYYLLMINLNIEIMNY